MTVTDTETLVSLAASLNGIDWEEHEHPRDWKGRFSRRGFGTFAFGNVKKAVFNNLFKGATTGAPETGEKVEIDLNPGEKLLRYKSSGALYVVSSDRDTVTMVRAADGSIPAEGSGVSQKITKPELFSGAALEQSTTFDLVSEAPYTEVKADSVEEAVAKVKDQQINSVLKGDTVKLPNGKSEILLDNQTATNITLNGDNFTVIRTQDEVSDVWGPQGEISRSVWGDTDQPFHANLNAALELADQYTTPTKDDSDAGQDNIGVTEVDAPIDLAGWKKTGAQAGSNPGGTYKNPAGEEFYVKQSKTEDHARNEVLARKLYDLAGIDSAQLALTIDGAGQLGTASPLIPGAKQDLSNHLGDKEYLAKIQDGFAVDAWLANWDVAGLVFDNVVTDGEGNPVRVDPGGALMYRAMGQPKGSAFGGSVGEWDSLRDGSNANSAKLFGSMTDEQLKSSAAKVAAITDVQIDDAVDSLGFNASEGDFLKSTLKARRDDIIKRAGLAIEAGAAEEVVAKVDIDSLNVLQKRQYAIDASDPADLALLSKDPDWKTRDFTAMNANTSPETLAELLDDKILKVASDAWHNPNTPESIKWTHPELESWGKASNPTIDAVVAEEKKIFEGSDDTIDPDGFTPETEGEEFGLPTDEVRADLVTNAKGIIGAQVLALFEFDDARKENGFDIFNAKEAGQITGLPSYTNIYPARSLSGAIFDGDLPTSPKRAAMISKTVDKFLKKGKITDDSKAYLTSLKKALDDIADGKEVSVKEESQHPALDEVLKDLNSEEKLDAMFDKPTYDEPLADWEKELLGEKTPEEKADMEELADWEKELLAQAAADNAPTAPSPFVKTVLETTAKGIIGETIMSIFKIDEEKKSSGNLPLTPKQVSDIIGGAPTNVYPARAILDAVFYGVIPEKETYRKRVSKIVAKLLKAYKPVYADSTNEYLKDLQAMLDDDTPLDVTPSVDVPEADAPEVDVPEVDAPDDSEPLVLDESPAPAVSYTVGAKDPASGLTITKSANGDGTFTYEIDGETYLKKSKKDSVAASIYKWPNGNHFVAFHKTGATASKAKSQYNAPRVGLIWFDEAEKGSFKEGTDGWFTVGYVPDDIDINASPVENDPIKVAQNAANELVVKIKAKGPQPLSPEGRKDLANALNGVLGTNDKLVLDADFFGTELKGLPTLTPSDIQKSAGTKSSTWVYSTRTRLKVIMDAHIPTGAAVAKNAALGLAQKLLGKTGNDEVEAHLAHVIQLLKDDKESKNADAPEVDVPEVDDSVDVPETPDDPEVDEKSPAKKVATKKPTAASLKTPYNKVFKTGEGVPISVLASDYVYSMPDGGLVVVSTFHNKRFEYAPDGTLEVKHTNYYATPDGGTLLPNNAPAYKPTDLDTPLEDLEPFDGDYEAKIWLTNYMQALRDEIYSKSHEEKMEWWASAEAQDSFSGIVRALHPDLLKNLSEAQKKKLTTDRLRLRFLMESARLAADIKHGNLKDLTPEERDEISARLAFFSKKFDQNANNWKFSFAGWGLHYFNDKDSFAYVTQNLTKDWRAHLWEVSNGDLKFSVVDQDNLPEKIQHLAELGIPGMEALNVDEANLLLKVQLGYPGVGVSEQNSANNTVKEAKLKAVAAQIHVSLGSKVLDLDKKTSIQKILDDAHEERLANLPSEIEFVANGSTQLRKYRVDADNPDVYNVYKKDYNDNDQYIGALSREELFELLQNSDTSYLPDANKTLYDSIKEQLATTSSTEVILAHGGAYASSMAPGEKGAWLEAFARGDSIHQYVIEAAAAEQGGKEHKDKYKHPGSPDSPEGALAWQSLADFLAVIPEGETLLNSEAGNTEFDTAFRRAFGHELGAGAVIDSWRELVGKNLPASTFTSSELLQFKDDKPPAGVPDYVWNLVLAVENDLVGDIPLDVFDVDSTTSFESITPSDVGAAYGIDKSVGLFAPASIGRLWKLADNLPHGSLKDSLYTAIRSRVNAGTYIPGNVPVWYGDNGTKTILTPGTQVYSYNGAFHFVFGHEDTRYYTASGPNVTPTAAGYKQYVDFDEFTLLYEIPSDKDFAAAQKAGYEGDSASFEAVTALEETVPHGSPHNLFHAFKAQDSIDPFLKYNGAFLPLGVVDHMVSNPNDVEFQKAAAFKLKQGWFGAAKVAGLFDMNEPFTKNIIQAQIQHKDVKKWTLEERKAFAKKFGTGSTPKAIAELLETLLARPDASEFRTNLVLPSKLELQNHDYPLLEKGIHSYSTWLDQDGNPWITKASPGSDNPTVRVEQEHYANVIGRLFGFKAPESRLLTTPDGHYAFAQHLITTKSSLAGKGPSDLTVDQLSEVMGEHILDWLLANHDSHGSNFLIGSNGQIVGIDKGASFKHLGLDKLAEGYKPEEVKKPIWYDNFYKAIRTGAIDQDVASAVVKSVLTKAFRIQRSSDAGYRSLLEKAWANRTDFPAHSDKEAAIDFLMERKASLVEDFEALYTGLFAKSSKLEMPDTSKWYASKLGDDVHYGLSQEFAEGVDTHRSLGQTMFVDSPDLEQSAILFYTQKQKSGADINTNLLGEMRITTEADVNLFNWLSKWGVEAEAPQNPSQYTNPSYKQLPSNHNTYWSIIESAAKTVTVHAVGGSSGVGEYNQSTLQSLKDLVDTLNKQRLAMNDHEALKPLELWDGGGQVPGGFQTWEQYDAYREMVDEYIGHAETIFQHKEAGTKVKPILTPYQFSSTLKDEDLKSPAFTDPYPVETFEDGTGHYTYTHWSNGNFTYKEGDSSFHITPTAYEEERLQGQNITKHAAPETGGPAEDATEHSAVMETVGYTATVKKRKTKIKTVDIDYATGDVQVLSEDQGKDFTTTDEYVIDVTGDNVLFHFTYTPRSASSDARRGRLRFETKNWDGSVEQMEEALSILREMGLQVDDSSPEHLESLFWTEYGHGVKNRHGAAKHTTAWTEIEAWKKANPTATHAELVLKQREEWAKVIGQDVVDGADWMPHFDKGNFREPEASTGKPFWVRPDWSFEEILKRAKTPTQSSLSGNHAKNMALLGGSSSSEERRRILQDKAPGGMSSGADQGSYGSSWTVFTRQNYNYDSGYQVYYHPKVLGRVGVYAAPNDIYGDLTGSNYSIPQVRVGLNMLDYSHASNGSNELDIPHSVAVLSGMLGLVISNESERNEVITLYKAAGITEINGISIDVFFGPHNALAKAIKEIYGDLKGYENKAGAL